MGLITRCPACGSMFKVVADQLKISEGWVRCGHCAEIFDATADLRDEAEIDLPTILPHPNVDSVGPESVSSDYPSVQSQVDDSAIDGAPDAIEIAEQVSTLHQHPLDQPFQLQREDAADVDAAGPHGFSKPVPLEAEPE